jgi:hypothetical protein
MSQPVKLGFLSFDSTGSTSPCEGGGGGEGGAREAAKTVCRKCLNGGKGKRASLQGGGREEGGEGRGARGGGRRGAWGGGGVGKGQV